jgi:hypothetical protein
MADTVITAPITGAPNQVTVAAASSGNATAGSVLLVVANGTTNHQITRALRTALDAVRRDPNVFTG